MSEKRSRFVLVCQQTLVIGVVVAVAAPAAGVVTMDIVAPVPPSGLTGVRAGQHESGSLVATEPVRPRVHQVAVDGVSRKGLEALRARPADRTPGATSALRLAAAGTEVDQLAALTAPEPVRGLATVGLTWSPGAQVAEEGLRLAVRTRTEDAWSGWTAMPYHDDHGPDSDTREGRATRPGSDAVYVGAVDDVQVKVVTATGRPPRGLQLALVDPGREHAPEPEAPAIDTGRLASATTGTAPRSGVDLTAADVGVASGTSTHTPRPRIFSRAQWGADESLRDRSSLHYGEIHAGFVHHTVNANGYTRAQVPAILRGIYAYHTRARGWSDIGYNFLVDRFGRIWEGRYGGVDRPVVGAHTLGYNEDAFAMSAIGNYDVYDKGRGLPSSAMLAAYGRLFAWKLSLHGVDAASMRQWVGKRYLPAINGHRDVDQTACPGRYLYAKIPTIRALAEADQRPFTARSRTTDVSGSRWPDLLARDRATKRLYVVHTAGQVGFGRPTRAASGFGGMDLVVATRDLTGDGIADVLARDARNGITAVHPGDGNGHFTAGVHRTTRFRGVDQLVGVGDLDRDGNNDVVGRRSGQLYLFPGNGKGSFDKAKLLARHWDYNLTVGLGDFDGDGHRDLAARDGSGVLWYVRVTGSTRLHTPRALPGRWTGYDRISGLGDATNDGVPDLVARGRRSGLTYIFPGNARGGLGTRFGPFDAFKGVDFLANAGQVAGNRRNDLVGRDAGGRLVVFANSGGRNVGTTRYTGTVLGGADLLLNVGDWNGDGTADLMTRSSRTHKLFFYAGDGRNHFARPVVAGTGWASVTMVAAVGDITGDGHPDLVGQPKGGAMRIYPGDGVSGLRASYVAHAPIRGNHQVGVGLWNRDGSPDTIVRRGDGTLAMYAGNGPGGLTSAVTVGTGAGRYDAMVGAGDVDGDGRPDLISRQARTGTLWLLPGTGSGLAGRRLVGTGFGGYDLLG
jgi:hypothetical protein